MNLFWVVLEKRRYVKKYNENRIDGREGGNRNLNYIHNTRCSLSLSYFSLFMLLTLILNMFGLFVICFLFLFLLARSTVVLQNDAATLTRRSFPSTSCCWRHFFSFRSSMDAAQTRFPTCAVELNETVHLN